MCGPGRVIDLSFWGSVPLPEEMEVPMLLSLYLTGSGSSWAMATEGEAKDMTQVKAFTQC